MRKIKIKKFQLAKDSKHWIFGKKNILLLTLTSHNSVISGNTALNIYIFIYSCIHIFIYSEAKPRTTNTQRILSSLLYNWMLILLVLPEAKPRTTNTQRILSSLLYNWMLILLVLPEAKPRTTNTQRILSSLSIYLYVAVTQETT